MLLLFPRSRGESTERDARRAGPLKLSVAALLTVVVIPVLAAGPAAAKPRFDPALLGLYGAADPTYDGVFRQSLGILGVVTAGETPSDEAVRWLLGQQCADGGFMAFNPEPSKPCLAPDPVTFVGEDTNSTALAVQALRGVGRTAAASSAADYLVSVRSKDGGWPYIPGGDSDPNSTGLALMALTSVGRNVDQAAVDFLAAAQVDCSGDPLDQGGITSPFSGGAPDVLATVQSVPGLAGADLLNGPASTAPWVDDAPALACPVASDDAETVSGWAASWLEAQVAADAVSGGNAAWAVLSFAATRTGLDEAEKLYAGIVADLGPDPAAKKAAKKSAKKSGSPALTAQTDESPGALGLAALSAAVLGESADLPGLAARISATETPAPTVEPSPKPTPPPSEAGPEAEGGAALPDTGTDPTLILLGTSLVLVGSALVLVTRRRREETGPAAGGGTSAP